MRGASRWLLPIVVALAAVLLAGPLAAQPSESDKATARSLMDRGDALVKEGKLDQARKAFKGADDIMRVPTTGLELGKIQVKVGKLLEATSTFLRVARSTAQPGEPGVFADSRKEAQRLANDIKPRIPSVLLEISGLKPGELASVKIDGNTLPQATLELPRQVNPGKHDIVGDAEGYKTITTSFDVAEGKTQVVKLAFEEGVGATVAPPPPPAKPSPPPEDDGADEGSTDDEGGISALTIAGFTIGGVGLALGAIMGGVVLSNKSKIEEKCTENPPNAEDAAQCPDDIDGTFTLAHISTVGFAVGGAGVALGIISLILDLSGDDSGDDTGMRPLLGPGFVGVEGSF